MRRTEDPFPKQGRIRGEYLAVIEHDPLEALLAKREAEAAATREAMDSGHATQQADPQDLRGIPCIARGVGGTSPGTNPLTEAVRRSVRYPRSAREVAAS